MQCHLFPVCTTVQWGVSGQLLLGEVTRPRLLPTCGSITLQTWSPSQLSPQMRRGDHKGIHKRVTCQARRSFTVTSISSVGLKHLTEKDSGRCGLAINPGGRGLCLLRISLSPSQVLFGERRECACSLWLLFEERRENTCVPVVSLK